MGLKGKTVRIIVSNTELNLKNLFGTIISDRGYEQLTIRLIEQITLGPITSNIVKIIGKKEDFNSLEKQYGEIYQCILVDEAIDALETIGEVAIAID